MPCRVRFTCFRSKFQIPGTLSFLFKYIGLFLSFILFGCFTTEKVHAGPGTSCYSSSSMYLYCCMHAERCSRSLLRLLCSYIAAVVPTAAALLLPAAFFAIVFRMSETFPGPFNLIQVLSFHPKKRRFIYSAPLDCRIYDLDLIVPSTILRVRRATSWSGREDHAAFNSAFTAHFCEY